MTQEHPASRLPQVACPTCGRKIPWSTQNPWRPFCSQRCRMIDLGEWLNEGMRIPADESPPEDDGTPGSEP